MVAPNEIQKVNEYMRQDIIRVRFAEIVGEHNAGAYISSVLLAVANDESGKLKMCTPASIYISALRAATLRLSVDPSPGQAYLVPFAEKATLIVGYKGYYDMAIRTGRYRYINVNRIYEGESVEFDRISGMAKLVGGKTGEKVAGWLAAFEMLNGYGKVIYMTLEEIHAYAQKYSKSYQNPKSGWKRYTGDMERKTPLRILLRKWGYLDPADVTVLGDIETEHNENEPSDLDGPEPPAEAKTEAQIMKELGYKETPYMEAVRRYAELCARADLVGITHDPIPEDPTTSQLLEAYSSLEPFVMAAEEVAQKKLL